MKSRRKFGVEIEFCTDEDIYSWAEMLSGATGITVDVYGYSYDSWKLVSDGSVNGWELVSPILQGKKGISQVEKMVKAMKLHGASMNQSCGLHVHVNAGDFSFANIMTAMKRYNEHEQRIDRAVALERQGWNCHYAQPMADYVADVVEQAKNKTQLRNMLEEDMIGRYAKLNICSYVEHGTLEFRQHEGTLNLRKMLNWIEFCVQFMDDVRTQKPFRAPKAPRVRRPMTPAVHASL